MTRLEGCSWGRGKVGEVNGSMRVWGIVVRTEGVVLGVLELSMEGRSED